MTELTTCSRCGSVQLLTQEGLCATCLLETTLTDSGIFPIEGEDSGEAASVFDGPDSLEKQKHRFESTEQTLASGIAAVRSDLEQTRTLAGSPTEEDSLTAPVHWHDPEDEDSRLEGTAELGSQELSLDFLTPSEKPDCLGTLGVYEIEQVIGRGGFGIVLKGLDPHLNRVVAIKVLSPELASDPTARQRFLREARSAAAVHHAHVVGIHEIEDNAVLPFLVMEFVDGVTLGQHIKQQGPLPPEEILRIGAQTAAGLSAAHAQGLIHRDIKPGNILLPKDSERVKITDFGLAKTAEDAHLTQTGTLAGTPQYMSPEQAEGEEVDTRTDLFSLGSVLYAMCSGEPPFRRENTVAMLRAVCEEEPAPISKKNRSVPKWLEEIVAKLMAKNAEDRFQSAGEVAELLEQHLAHLQNPKKTPRPRRVGRTRTAKPRRRRWLVAAALLFVVFAGFASMEATGVTGVTNFVATVLRIRTPDGTLVVEVDDPNIKIEVTGDGDVIIRGAGPQELRLKPGQYQVKATGNGVTRTQWITIERGGRQILRVHLEPALAAKQTNSLPRGPSWKVLTGDDWEWTEPVNLGPAVNSPQHEAGPCLSSDGLTLLFCSTRPGGEGSYDLWQSTRKTLQDPWSRATPLGPTVNSPKHDSAATLSDDGLTLLFNSFRPGGQGRQDLWMATRTATDQAWGAPVNLGAKINGPHRDDGPFLSSSGLRLYFCSDRPGGQGEVDLWVCQRTSTTEPWSKPIPVSGQVNRFCPEFHPCGLRDDLTLVLQGPGPNNNAIWLSKRNGPQDPWSDPIPVDLGVRDGDQCEPCFSADGRTMYFHSNQSGGQGGSDLYVVRRVPKARPLTEADVQWIAALPAAEQVSAVANELERLNPGFDGTVIPEFENGAVVGLKFSTEHVFDISPLRALSDLRTLDCEGPRSRRGKLRDLSPLKGLALTELNLNYNPISDLSPLQGMPLKQLKCDGSNVSDLSSLKGMPLKKLLLTGAKVDDLSPLRGMPLESLFVEGSSCSVTDLSPLKGMRVKALGLAYTKVSDLSPLKGMPLRYFNCDSTKVTDLSPLRDSPLKKLCIHNTRITDLSPLEGMALTHFSYQNISAKDVSVLKKFPLTAVHSDFRPERDAAVWRAIPTLREINHMDAKAFWKKVDAENGPLK